MPVCEVETLTFGYILVLSTPCLALREVAVSLTEGWVLSQSFQDHLLETAVWIQY